MLFGCVLLMYVYYNATMSCVPVGTVFCKAKPSAIIIQAQRTFVLLGPLICHLEANRELTACKKTRVKVSV